MNWPALAAARARQVPRLPFLIEGLVVGSVARADLHALQAWPQWLSLQDDGVSLTAADRDGALATINMSLRQQDLVRAWRDEWYAIRDPASGHHLARTERAASRFWGTLTLGAHANGYVADARGRPTHLWIARRSLSKATDPGLLDNLVGGGVSDGQTPHETLLREGWEEAGLTPAQMAQARPGRVIRLHRDIPEGLQFEDLHCFDLQLAAGLVPRNQDGEVSGFELLTLEQALAHAATEGMTVDAALVTLEFGLRHGALDHALAQALEAAAAGLWSGSA